MKLVALIASLSATSKKKLYFNGLSRKTACLSRLSLENKRQAKKKPNEINACRLVALVAPTEDADADKRRPPVGAFGKFMNNREIRNRGKATHEAGGRDKLSGMSFATSRALTRYLKAPCLETVVREGRLQ